MNHSAAQLEIRRAGLEDVPIISLLGRVTFAETFGHLFRDWQDLLDYHDRTFSIAKICSSIQKEENLFWLALVNELPVGYGKLKLYSPNSFLKSDAACQLQKIYVLRDFLSMHIGFELQERMLEKARELNYEHIWLSVLDSNERAIRFYEKNGFEKLGSHDFQIGIEEFNFFAMGKSLK